MRSIRYVLFGSSLAVALSTLGARMSEAEEPLTTWISTIRAEWQARQDRFRSVDITWKQPTSGDKLWTSYQSAGIPSPGFTPKEPENRLVLDRNRMRYETNRWWHRSVLEFSRIPPADTHPLVPRDVDGGIARTDPEAFNDALDSQFSEERTHWRNPRRFISLLDGHRRTDFLARGASDYADAFVYEGLQTDELPFGYLDDLFIRPLLLVFRPLETTLGGVDLESCEILDSDSFVNGHQCVLMQETCSEVHQIRYWIDPSRSCVITRAVGIHHGRHVTQQDWEYRHDHEHGWLPSGWTTVHRGRLVAQEDPGYPGEDRLHQFLAAEVSTAKMNPKVPPGTFDVEFEPGTFVIDFPQHERYLVLADGTRRRIVTDGSRRLSYDALIVGETATITEERSIVFWLSWITAGAAFLTAGLVSIRQRSQRGSGGKETPGNIRGS